MNKTSTKKEKVVWIPFQISVRTLAQKLDLAAAEIIKKLLDLGIIANINENIDFETASLIAEDFGFSVKLDQEITEGEVIDQKKLQEILRLEQEDQKNLVSRPPVVTILGHVDHGKTTLLDALRKTRVAEKESGGITQHISAYQLKKEGSKITFIDTPGHEAFQAMRERGASIADIAILVVAADDGVKPQTKEVASFLLENKVPTIVAINKIDKPESNPRRVKQELAEIGILVEGYGGDIPVVEVSAKKRLGLEDLLETILLVAEMNNFSANPQRPALGIVLEAKKDPKTGPTATVLIKTGTLKEGQDVFVGEIFGRIRRMEDFTGKKISLAQPSDPVKIIGLPAVPQSNDILFVPAHQNIKKKKLRLIQKSKKAAPAKTKIISSQDILQNINQALTKKFPIIIKTDVQGTLEAIKQILATIKSTEISLEIIEEGVGPITESDVISAQAAQAIIYGFNVFPTSVAARMAEGKKVEVKTFSVIYELIQDIKKEMSDRLEPEIRRVDLGKLKVLAVFKSAKKQMIVGGKVISGKIVKGEHIETERNGAIINQGIINQLQHNKEDVAEVKSGLECGLSISFTGEKIQVNDIIHCYQEEEIKKKIE